MSIECTSVFLDIRDFTNILNKYHAHKSFYELIECVYNYGLVIGKELAENNDYYINSTGDGFLCIFFGDYHYLKGFAFSLLLHLVLPKYFNVEFDISKNEGDYWFGIGIESGIVDEVKAVLGNKSIVTYLGNVINIAARLEGQTKDHARSPIIFGPELNELLTAFIHNISYKSLIKHAKEETDSNKAKLLHEKMALINSDLLSSYIFEHRIKGLNTPIPLFRVSPSLQDINKDHFWNFISKLPIKMKDNIKNILITNNFICRF